MIVNKIRVINIIENSIYKMKLNVNIQNKYGCLKIMVAI